MWILIFIIGLVILIVIALQFPKVQHFAAQKGASYLSSTLDTKVEIGGFTTDWRNTLVLKDVYVEDQQQDTLWYSERLGVDMRIFSLLSSNINISKIDLDNATLKLHIRPDSSTNFDFITEAFATDTTSQPADTAAAPMNISLGIINLNNVYVNFKDEAGGNLVKTRVGELTTSMDKLNLEEERYLVDEVELRNTWFEYVQTKLPPPSESEPLTMEFGLNRVELENISLRYVSLPADQSINLKLGQAELLVDNIDLPNARIELSKFELHNTNVAYAQDKYKPTDSLSINPEKMAEDLNRSVEKTQGQPVNWVVKLDELEVSNVDAALNNFNVPRQPRGMDYNHLNFKNVRISANDVSYSLNRYVAEINQFTFQEQSGFQIKNFNAGIEFDSTSARIANLDLQTGNSHIRQDLIMSYPSFDALTNNPEQITLDVNIDNSSVGMRDVQYFAPHLLENPSFRPIANSTLRVDGHANGSLDNLQVKRFQMAGLQGTRVNVSGNVRNALDPDNLFLNMRINRFATTRTDILALVPQDATPPDIRIPAELSMTGSYQGSLTKFDANADIATSYGNVNAVVDMAQGPAGAEPFNARISTNGFNIGQMLTEDLGLGTIALTATANGRGLTPETMVADVEAQIQEVDYNGYAYNNIIVDAEINKNLYNVTASSTDKNIAFNLNGDFNLRDAERNLYDFTLDLERANLQALNLYEEELIIQAEMRGRFTGKDASTLSGSANIRNALITHNGKDFPVDSMILSLNQQGENTEVLVRSDILAADMLFENSLATLPTALQKHFSNYFDLQPDPPYPANLNLGDFVFAVDLKKTELLTSFVPGLIQLSPADSIRGSYNGETQDLSVEARLSRVRYLDYDLRRITVSMDGNKEQLGYEININQVQSPALVANNIILNGSARDNDLTVQLAVMEDNGQARFMIGGLMNSLGRGYRFSLNPEQLVINGDQWKVSEDNYLQFDTNLLYANNIRLERGNSYILLNSTGEVRPNAPLNIQFNNFDIGYLMETFQQEDSLIAGILNGEATLRNIMSDNMALQADMTVSEFAYMGVPVGNIALEADNSGTNRYNLAAALTGNGNQVKVNGIYEIQPNASLLNLDANINSLNLASLEGFTEGMVKDMAGSATGKLRITGTLEHPDIIGNLNFDQAQFNISMLNSLYRLQDERLVFTEQGIRFPNVTVTDSLGNDLVINGNVLTQNYTEYTFDLTAKTNRFLAMNSTAQDNDLYYGTVFIDATARITGNQVRPVINADVNVLGGSDFTTVIPAEEVGAAEREGIVEFVNLNDSLTAIVGQKKADSTQTAGFLGADIDVRLKVTDATKITIVIDPTTGDNLVVRGNADPMLFGIQPSGQINMTGRYEITDGKYSMDFYDLVSRELDITSGSYIAWTGDPLQANFQITAIYTVETAPMELVAAQIGGTQDPVLRNQVPFKVYVNVDGELLQPDIGFDIRIPEQQQGQVPAIVSTSLGNLRQDAAEMNKQVFALLVLGRFLAPDPFTSSGGGFAATARNSLSQVMTDQLNQLTNRYAGGLGLELGVNSYEDYSSGSAEGRTDLNVALRQQFLNDRLTVRVGTDIGIEGGQQQSNRVDNMSGFGGDISVEYSITENGNLRVRAFQRNQFEDFLEGDIRATGAALIYMREYHNFSDLFRDLESRRAREEERRLQQARKLSAEQ